MGGLLSLLLHDGLVTASGWLVSHGVADAAASNLTSSVIAVVSGLASYGFAKLLHKVERK